MPSAEEILKARDEPVAKSAPSIPVDYPEEKHPSEQGESPPRREPGEPSPKRQEPPGDDDDGHGPDDSGDDDKGPVPYQALKAERQKAQEKTKRYTEEVVDLRKQIAELTSAVIAQRQQPQQPQAPKPEPEFDWDNPLATVDQRFESRISQERAAIQAEFQRQREAMQSQFAMTRHGEETVKAAYGALQAARETDPNWLSDYQRIMRSPDQYEAMVQWHKQRSALQEVGSDLDAYKAKIRAEYLEELRTGRVTDDISAEPPREKRPATVMPSNLSGARSVSSRNGAAWSGPPSIKDLLGNR
jgi:hypothetical protein